MQTLHLDTNICNPTCRGSDTQGPSTMCMPRTLIRTSLISPAGSQPCSSCSRRRVSASAASHSTPQDGRAAWRSRGTTKADARAAVRSRSASAVRLPRPCGMSNWGLSAAPARAMREFAVPQCSTGWATMHQRRDFHSRLHRPPARNCWAVQRQNKLSAVECHAEAWSRAHWHSECYTGQHVSSVKAVHDRVHMCNHGDLQLLFESAPAMSVRPPHERQQQSTINLQFSRAHPLLVPVTPAAHSPQRP